MISNIVRTAIAHSVCLTICKSAQAVKFWYLTYFPIPHSRDMFVVPNHQECAGRFIGHGIGRECMYGIVCISMSYGICYMAYGI